MNAMPIAYYLCLNVFYVIIEWGIDGKALLELVNDYQEFSTSPSFEIETQEICKREMSSRLIKIKRYVAKGLPYSCNHTFILLSMFMTCGLILMLYKY